MDAKGQCTNYEVGDNLSLYNDGTIALDSGTIVAHVTDTHDGLGRVIEMTRDLIDHLRQSHWLLREAAEVIWLYQGYMERAGLKMDHATPAILEDVRRAAKERFEFSLDLLNRLDKIEANARLPRPIRPDEDVSDSGD